MRACIFSDLHGNGPAFRAAYPLILAEEADAHVFLGDLCGYYFDQLEILEQLLSLPNLLVLRGNHDQIFLDITKGDEGLRKSYLEKYGPSMDALMETDTGEFPRWLAGLPVCGAVPEVDGMASHANPWAPLEGYIYPDADLGRLDRKSVV